MEFFDVSNADFNMSLYVVLYFEGSFLARLSSSRTSCPFSSRRSASEKLPDSSVRRSSIESVRRFSFLVAEMILPCALTRNMSSPFRVFIEFTIDDIFAKSLSKATCPENFPSKKIGEEYSTIITLVE